VRFFPHAAAAEAAGFRACLRCRPEAAPGQPASAGTSATVARGLRLINEGALDAGSLAAFAARLGVGSRHLTRLFREHLGVPPGAVARARRVHFARQLLDATDLPVAEIAFAAGFRSLRRFNEAIRAAFGQPPTSLRARRARAEEPGLWIRVPFRPPLDWEAMLAFLAVRAVPGVERVDGEGYARTVATAQGPVVVDVRAHPDGRALRVRVTPPQAGALLEVVGHVRRMFDLDADPEAIAAALSRDERLAPAVRARPGLRVPGGWEGFEVLVRAVLGQQISVAAAVQLAGRLTALCGEPLGAASAPGLTHAFPAPAALARLDPATLPMPRARGAAVVGLARAAVRGELPLQAGASLEAALEGLRGLPGIGPWTAHILAMRALREPDAFPAGDLGIRRALGAPGSPAAEAEVLARAEAWRPWRAYAAQHLWAIDADRAQRHVLGPPAGAGVGA
jgi:AraC family transcriptional regulator of adaptative response / DNA-3-methyladenine glycosylase II